MKKAYDIRVVAFLDILGFAALIDASENKDEMVGDISNIVDYPRRALDGVQQPALRKHFPTVESSTFSDSIVISARANAVGLANILTMVQIVNATVLGLGRFIRGGIAVGQMYHDKEAAFGPALVKAIRLEQDFAVYPRIVLEEYLIEKIPEAEKFLVAVNEGRPPLIKRDRDGLDYVNPAHAYARESMEDMRENVRLIAQSTERPRERMKVVWAVDEWNAAFVASGLQPLTPAETQYREIDLFGELEKRRERSRKGIPHPAARAREAKNVEGKRK